MDSNSIIVVREATNMITTLGAEIIGGLVTGGFILLTAYLTYKFGLQTYFKKREHEQILRRYLEEGFDRASASVEHALGVFNDNYRTALEIVREIKVDETVDHSVIFKRYEQRYFDAAPFLKVGRLIGDNIFWKSTQLLFAFVDGKHIFFEKDFRSAVEQVLDGKIEISTDDLLDETRKKLLEFCQEAKKYYYILAELQTIASVLEQETALSWADLSQFEGQPEIKESVKRMKLKFAELESISPKDEQKQ